MGDENPIRTLGDYSKPSHEGYRNTIELPECSFHGLWSEDPNQHLKDFLKLVDSLDLDGENRERMCMRRTTKLRNDILMFQQHHGESLFEAWTRFKDLLQKVPHHGIDLWLQLRDLNPKESWAILEDLALYDNESWNDPRDFTKPVKAIALPQVVPSTSDRRLIELENQNCIENPKQAFVEYASLRTDEAGEARLSKFEADFKRQQGEMTNKIDTMLKAITDQIAGILPNDTVKNPKLGTHLVLSAQDDGEVMFIEIIRDDDEPQNEDPNEEEGATTEEPGVEYFDTFPTRNELTYHRHVHIKKAYIDLNSPLNIMTRIMSNYIMRRKLNPMKDANGGISNFIGRIKGMHVFVGNFTYAVDFMIVEDISSILDPRLSQVMPHKIKQYDSLSDLEKEHTKSVYLRNEEDKRRGVEYFSFGRHLDELHVTWAHLEKKRTRLRINTKTLEDLCSQSLETESQAIHNVVTTHQVTASHHFMTASARTDLNPDLEDSSYDSVLENQLLSASLLICLGKYDCVERIPSGRKAHLLEDRQISSVGVFDEVLSTWMIFRGNTRDLGPFGEETDKITTLHQDS
ncbi:hypothetical protein Tco_1284693 [Tanacetum coccineum]